MIASMSTCKHINWPRAIATLLLVILALVPPALEARSVTDGAGRTVDVPDRIERVMPAGAPASVLLYTLAPAKLLGWTHAPGGSAQAFLDVSLPQLPSLLRDGQVQIDDIRAVKPDLIVDYGSIAPRYAERARKLQEATGIPVLLLDGSLEKTPEIYRLLGLVLGNEARASELADAAATLLAGFPQPAPSPAIRLYYARSADGLTTATSASTLADIPRLIGATNVTDATGTADGLVKVSLDQIVGWNPDAIVSNSPGFLKTREAPEWARLAAVVKGGVFVAPALPWGWIDEPPSVNRLIGPLWLAGALVLRHTHDLRATARNFYQRFYRTELTSQQLQELLP
jgi:iron complex transport system substrate-binding protein